MLCGERLGKLNPYTDDEIAALVGLFALRHAVIGEALCEVGSCRASVANGDLLSVDGLHNSLPAGQRFFEVELDYVLDVVAFACKEGMWFLYTVSNVFVIRKMRIGLPLTQ